MHIKTFKKMFFIEKKWKTATTNQIQNTNPRYEQIQINTHTQCAHVCKGKEKKQYIKEERNRKKEKNGGKYKKREKIRKTIKKIINKKFHFKNKNKISKNSKRNTKKTLTLRDVNVFSDELAGKK